MLVEQSGLSMIQEKCLQSDRPIYRQDIDGLRCIAVLSVVAYHFGLSFAGGFTGVDIFFVISGYLIGSQIYLETRQGRFSYATFYYRRARRIVPALVAVLMATGAAMCILASPMEMRDFFRDALGAIFSVSNVTLYRSIDYFRPGADSNPLLMTWSLGVEEQFYIIAPLVIAVLLKLRASWRFGAVLFLSLTSLALSMWLVQRQPQAAFYLLPARAWELAVGVLLALWRAHHAQPAVQRQGWRQEGLSALGLLMLVAPIATYSHSTSFPGLAALPSVLGTALLLHTDESFINRKILSNRVTTFFGLISYSLYLWHWPLISIANMVLEGGVSLLLRLVLLAISILLAYASYRWIETPFRHSGGDQTRSLRRYAYLMGGIAVVFGWGFAAGGLPQRWAPELVSLEMDAQPQVNGCLAGYGKTGLPTAGVCLALPADGQRGVALVGDSHASALSPALRSLAHSSGLVFSELTKSSCPFLSDVSRLVPKYPQHAAECGEFNDKVMRTLLDTPSIDVVVMGGFWGIGLVPEGRYVAITGGDAASDPQILMQQGLAKAVATLVEAGKRVVVVGDVPFFEFMPIKRAITCASPLRAQMNSLADRSLGCESGGWSEIDDDGVAQRLVEQVARSEGAVYFDPRAVLCDQVGCKFVDQGRMLFVDRQHLSIPGAKMALDGLGALILTR